MTDPVDAFFGAEPEAPEIVSEPVEQVVETPPAAPVEAEQTPEVAPEPESKPEHTVPLPKYLDTRDELKEAKRKLAEYEARTAPRDDVIPDPLDDPEGFRAYQGQQINQLKLEMSYEMATEKHGAEKVEAARLWAMERANGDPAFDAQVKIELARQRNPMEWIVRQHHRDAMLAQLPSDVSSFEEYIEREIAKRTSPEPAVAPVVAATPQAQKPVAPPRSIASDTSASRQIAPQDDKAEFLAALMR